jgi:hypothetical protein
MANGIFRIIRNAGVKSQISTPSEATLLSNGYLGEKSIVASASQIFALYVYSGSNIGIQAEISSALSARQGTRIQLGTLANWRNPG